VRWIVSEELTVGVTTLLFARQKSRNEEGVALAVHTKLTLACVLWTPLNGQLLSAGFEHTAGTYRLLLDMPLCPPLRAEIHTHTHTHTHTDRSVKEEFYVKLDSFIPGAERMT